MMRHSTAPLVRRRRCCPAEGPGLPSAWIPSAAGGLSPAWGPFGWITPDVIPSPHDPGRHEVRSALAVCRSSADAQSDPKETTGRYMKTPSCAASTATPRSPQHPARTSRARDRTSQPLTAPVRSARILMPPWRPSVDRSRTKFQPSPTPASQAVLPKTHERSAEITAIIAVLTATGIRLPELIYLRCSDVDLWQRETRSATRAARTGSATRPPGAWTGTSAPAPGIRTRGGRSCGGEPGNREPLTTAGIYQMIARHGRRCGLSVYSHRLRHHFSRLAGPRRAPRETSWNSTAGPPADALRLRRQRPQRPRPPLLRPHHDRHTRPLFRRSIVSQRSGVGPATFRASIRATIGLHCLWPGLLRILRPRRRNG